MSYQFSGDERGGAMSYINKLDPAMKDIHFIAPCPFCGGKPIHQMRNEDVPGKECVALVCCYVTVEVPMLIQWSQIRKDGKMHMVTGATVEEYQKQHEMAVKAALNKWNDRYIIKKLNGKSCR